MSFKVNLMSMIKIRVTYDDFTVHYTNLYAMGTLTKTLKLVDDVKIFGETIGMLGGIL